MLHILMTRCFGRKCAHVQQIKKLTACLLAVVMIVALVPAQAAQSLPNYCVRIPEDWDGAGKSLGALKFWRATGATVVAIRRSGQEIVSPGPDTALRCGDLLIFVGDLEARKGVVRFFSSNP